MGTDTILAKDLLMPKPNQKASHGTMVDMVVMEVGEDGMAANAVLLTLNLSLKLRANHTYSMGIIHIMLDTTILARDQLMLSQNHIMVDILEDTVDITGVRTTKDNETDLSCSNMNSLWNSCTNQLANIFGCKFLDISCLIFFFKIQIYVNFSEF